MKPSDLIGIARLLARRGRRGKPRQSNLKIAVSTAYYAMFHALCWTCADAFIGKTKALRSQRAWRQAYRSVEHGFAKKQCRNESELARFPGDIRDFANLFAVLQQKRHLADYDPFSKFRRSEVLFLVDSAEAAIKELQRSDIKDKRAFVAWTTMKNR